MSMKVGVNSGVNSGVNFGVNFGSKGSNGSPKQSNTGAKIGAGVGFTVGTARTYFLRDMITNVGEELLAHGYSKGIARTSQAATVMLGIGLFVGIGALAGKGVQKVMEHFKKDKPKAGGVIPGENPNSPTKIFDKKFKPKAGGVIPGENPNPQPKVEGNPFEKFNVGRTVITKDKEEYVVVDGHPKKIFKKNPETGELEFKTDVYDGSWGKEASDESIVQSIKDMEKVINKK